MAKPRPYQCDFLKAKSSFVQFPYKLLGNRSKNRVKYKNSKRPWQFAIGSYLLFPTGHKQIPFLKLQVVGFMNLLFQFFINT